MKRLLTFLTVLLSLSLVEAGAQVTTIPAGTTVNTQQDVGNGETLNAEGAINGSPGEGVEVETNGTGAATVNNSGEIINSDDDGIDATADDSSDITINNSGLIRNSDGDGINVNANDSSTVTVNNSGEIRNSDDSGIEIETDDFSRVTATNSGLITNSDDDGVDIEADDDSQILFTNNGIIRNSDDDGIDVTSSNRSIVTVINNGTINESDEFGIEGVVENSGNLTITNNGIIRNSGDDGINLEQSDSSTAVINNAGTINLSGRDGIFANPSNNGSLVINHSGVINNSTRNGIRTRGSSTINLSGIIRNTGDNDSIRMGGGDDILNVFGRAQIDGRANGRGHDTADTINFNLRGLNADDQATFNSLVFNGTEQTVSIFNRNFVFVNFEAGSVSLASYSSLLPDHLSQFGAFLDNLNGTPNFLLDVLNVLSTAPVGTELNNAVTNLIGLDGIEQFKREAFSFGPGLSRSLGHYFHNLRQGGTGWDTSQVSLYDPNLPLAMQPYAQHQLLAGTTMVDGNTDPVNMAKVIEDDAPATDWGGFVQVQGTYSEQDANENFAEADATSIQINVGADKRINDNLAIGALIGYSRTDADVDSLDSEVIDNAVNTALYTHFSEGNSFIEGMIGYRAHFYEYDRNIIAGAGTATSDTVGHQLPASIRVGHDFKFGEDRQWTFTPQAALHYSLLYVDGYSESGAGALNLIVDDMSAQSLQSEVGFRLARRYTGNYGWVSPSLYASYNHEFLDDNTSVGTRFSGGLTPFNVRTADPERDFAILGIALDGTPADYPHLHFGLRYDVQVGQDDYLSHTASAHMRVDL